MKHREYSNESVCIKVLFFWRTSKEAEDKQQAVVLSLRQSDVLERPVQHKVDRVFEYLQMIQKKHVS